MKKVLKGKDEAPKVTMPKITVSILHALTESESKKRLKGLIDSSLRQNGAIVSDSSINWNGRENSFSFRAQGVKISGSIIIKERSLTIQVKLPLSLLPFKHMIANRIKKQVENILK